MERSRSEDERRIITIMITARGRNLLGKAQAVHSRFVESQLSHLTEKEMRQLLSCFTRLAEAAEAYRRD